MLSPCLLGKKNFENEREKVENGRVKISRRVAGNLNKTYLHIHEDDAHPSIY